MIKGKKIMLKFFEEIEIEIVRLDTEDIITTSEPWTDPDQTEDDRDF